MIQSIKMKVNNIGVCQHFIKEVCYMDKDKSISLWEEPAESISLWEEPEESTYYDRRVDLQGEVPGCSLKEARDAYEREYGISLPE